jgi:hypothetical protein
MTSVIRELIWALAAFGGTLIWLLWNTRDQGPLLEDLLGQEMLWNFVKIYSSAVLARITWWALRAVAGTAS